MKFRHFLQMAQDLAKSRPDILDATVVVPCENPSVGASAATAIKGMSVGFDWNAGKVFFSTEDAVLRLPNSDNPRKTYEDTHCAEVKQDKTGTTLSLKHRGAYVGDHLRTEIHVGDMIRIIKLTPPKSADRK